MKAVYMYRALLEDENKSVGFRDVRDSGKPVNSAGLSSFDITVVASGEKEADTLVKELVPNPPKGLKLCQVIDVEYFILQQKTLMGRTQL